MVRVSKLSRSIGKFAIIRCMTKMRLWLPVVIYGWLRSLAMSSEMRSHLKATSRSEIASIMVLLTSYRRLLTRMSTHKSIAVSLWDDISRMVPRLIRIRALLKTQSINWQLMSVILERTSMVSMRLSLAKQRISVVQPILSMQTIGQLRIWQTSCSHHTNCT